MTFNLRNQVEGLKESPLHTSKAKERLSIPTPGKKKWHRKRRWGSEPSCWLTCVSEPTAESLCVRSEVVALSGTQVSGCLELLFF